MFSRPALPLDPNAGRPAPARSQQPPGRGPLRFALVACLAITAFSTHAADPEPAALEIARSVKQPAAADAPAATAPVAKPVPDARAHVDEPVPDAGAHVDSAAAVDATATAPASAEATREAKKPEDHAAADGPDAPDKAEVDGEASDGSADEARPLDAAALYGEKADELAQWRRRVERLALGLETGKSTRADANRLYAELSTELWPMQAAVRDAIHADAPDLIEQHAALVELYALRSELFPLLSQNLRLKLTGLNPIGRSEAAREFDYFAVHIEHQRHILEGGLKHLQIGFEEAPISAVWRAVQIVFCIVVFRWWRRWAKDGIPEMRRSLLAARPRKPGTLRRARVLWYVDRVRKPLEWLALLWLVAGLLRPTGFEEISALVRTIVKWLLIGALAVSLLDARAARNARRTLSDTDALRMRSLRLVGYWGVLFGLAVDLTDRYAGTGVLHTWVVRAGIVAALPVAVLLIHWWKAPIFERVEARRTTSEWAERLLRRQKGFGSYSSAALAGVFLLRDGTIQVIVRMLSSYEFGRRVVAQLVRREVAKEGEKQSRPDEAPIADEIILPLIAARDVRIDEIAEGELDRMQATIEEHAGGASAVIGERGAGKSIFLERLAERFDGAMPIVRCPVGGYEAIEAAIAETFEIAPGEGLAGRLDAAIEKNGIRAIGIDDLHRLPRPWLGGQRALARLASLVNDLESEASWVFTFDKRAWRYVALAGGERTLLHGTVDLPMWTEEQIAELVTKRAAAIDLEPDYEELVLPRQLDTGEHEDDEQRNRFGYARILWELADGNPEVSLYLFAESLRRRTDDKVILRLPQLSSPESLMNAPHEALLVLRGLMQCDVASCEDLARSLQLPIKRVEQILRFCTQNGWVTVEHGGHRVSWRWFRSVTRALVRQNLMTR